MSIDQQCRIWELESQVSDLSARCAALEAERDRLREALLEEHTTQAYTDLCTPWCEACKLREAALKEART